VAQSIYDKNLSRSELLNSNKLAEIPRFAMQEIFEGLVLGSGCFASVYEVRGFSITEDDGQRLSLSRDDDEVNPGEIESRKFIAKHCYRSNGDARYAIKRLRQATICESLSYMNGMADLATETLFLASLQHPNIIKLRGIAKEDMFSEEYYLILDRLYDTLTVRVRKWKKRKKQSQGIMGSFKDRDGSAKKQLFEERMQYGLDLAAAIAYIHKQMIIHRDLKSENIGFDVVSTLSIGDVSISD
jgi:serine/threonine protein kinase